MVPTTTNSLKSIPIIIGFLVLPLFVAGILSYYIITLLEGTGLAVGFAVPFLNTIKNIVTVFDEIAIFAFTVSFGAVILRSFRLNISPIFGAIGLLLLPIIVYAAAFTSNIAGFFTSITFLQGAANQFPLTYSLFQNSAAISAGLGLIVLLVMVGGGMVVNR